MNVAQRNVAKRFGENLTKIREEQGLSQEELGFRCRLHRTSISNYECAKQEPGVAIVIKLASGLGVPADRLCEGIEWLPEDERFEIEATD